MIITYLDKLADKKYLDEKKSNLWKAIPYQTNKFSGVMLGNGGGPSPVPLNIRLMRKGTYRIFLGLYSGWKLPCVRVRLSNDLCCKRVSVPEKNKETVYDISCTIYEVFWKETDLTGQSLILESNVIQGTNVYPGALAYIRLEPIDKINASESETLPPPLFITEDGHGIFKSFSHSRPEDLLEVFENNIPNNRNYVHGLLWGNGDADACNYPTKAGNYWYVRDSCNYSGHTFYRNIRLWRKKGWDSMELVRKYAKRRNWEFQVYIRMQAFASPFPFDGIIHSNFFDRYPQYHCLDRKGQRAGRLSYAYPAVQNHMLALIDEIIQYKPDGICLCLIRGVPLVLYESIMIEGFKKEYGTDPRRLPATDKRWESFQAKVITLFIRKVKDLLKPHQRLSVIVPGLHRDCERWGLDVATWVKEEIVNDVFPFGQYFDKREVHRFDVKSLDFKYFNSLENREKIRLIPMAAPISAYPYATFRREIRSHLKQGADGYAAWDGVSGNRHITDIAIDCNSKKSGKSMPVPIKRINLLSLGGFRHNRYHHFEVT